MKRTSEENIAIAEKIRAYAKKHPEASYAALQKRFGDKYQLAAGRIRRIVLNECWRHVPPPEGENWKPVTLGGNVYHISDTGRVWSSVSGRELSALHASGYHTITHKDDRGVMVDTRVHRLVLELFDRPAQPGEVGRHLDDNRANNHISNLAWGSQYENSDDALDNGKTPIGSRGGKAKLTEQQVHDLFFNYDKAIHGGVKAYARQLIADGLPVTEASVVRIFRGSTWSHVTKLKRRHILGDTKPLDMKAALAIHHNWNKSGATLREFCSMFSKFLAAKGYGGITPDTVKRVISGKRFPRAHFEYYQ